MHTGGHFECWDKYAIQCITGSLIDFLDSQNLFLDPTLVQLSQMGAKFRYWFTLHNTQMWRPSWILDKYTFNQKTGVSIGFLEPETLQIDPEFILLDKSVTNSWC